MGWFTDKRTQLEALGFLLTIGTGMIALGSAIVAVLAVGAIMDDAPGLGTRRAALAIWPWCLLFLLCFLGSGACTVVLLRRARSPVRRSAGRLNTLHRVALGGLYAAVLVATGFLGNTLVHSIDQGFFPLLAPLVLEACFFVLFLLCRCFG